MHDQRQPAHVFKVNFRRRDLRLSWTIIFQKVHWCVHRLTGPTYRGVVTREFWLESSTVRIPRQLYLCPFVPESSIIPWRAACLPKYLFGAGKGTD